MRPSATKWPPIIGGVAVMLIVFAVVYAAVNGARQQADLVGLWQAERHDGQRQRAVLIRGQRDLQVRIDELAQQNTELVELLQEQGIDVPASLVTRTNTRTIERDSSDSDSDSDGDTVIVNPPRSSPSTSPDSDDVSSPGQLEIPEVPLPDLAGEATDNVKRMVPLP